MLGRFRTDAWRRRGFWLRGLGLLLLLAAFFLPLPASWVASIMVPGLAIFLLGALVWLARDAEAWLRK